MRSTFPLRKVEQKKRTKKLPPTQTINQGGLMANRIKPEILAPAGSPMALRAAIEGGADAVYIGGVAFNARINAKNFTQEELSEGIALAHTYGAKVYIAANTLIYDREREDYLRAAEAAYLSGADALIVADVGMARELKKRIPIELHASTQLSGHNVEAAQRLAEAGFSRMVCAREMSGEDIRSFCERSPIEAEVFVHGALCVSTSGQCLFSSLVGGRSGNRGECAQPCRLPYSSGKGKQEYPLSLRDLSLAEHITELCDMGVASFKIEGRMKSPEYVRDVTRIWRRLLDEGHNASKEVMSELAAIFSRGGFTDGYFTKNIGRKMLGVRSEGDKKQSAELKPFENITKKIALEMSAHIRAEQPISLTVKSGDREARVEGPVPEKAINAPLSRETIERNLSKLGGTPYRMAAFELELDEGLMLPISALNALRRAAVEEIAPQNNRKRGNFSRKSLDIPQNDRKVNRSALFYDPSQIPERAYQYFDRIYVPLEDFERYGREGICVMLPEVIFDSQREQVRKMLADAKKKGAAGALIGNIGHIRLAKEAGLPLFGDMRLNATNNSSVSCLEELGFEEIILSPELSLAQIRDIGGRTSAVVYGRAPLMLTEKCVGKELGGCERCQEGKQSLTDRKGVSFPVRKRYGHRSVIFNSAPFYMADKEAELSRYGITQKHFIFSVESKKQIEEIIEAYSKGKAPTANAIKRIK